MITLLGATGSVGGKIADLLIKKGEAVRLVARTPERLRMIAGKRATALAGDLSDTGLLVNAFKHADAVFTMIPPDPRAENFMEYADRIGESIVRAIELANVKYVVNLSSIGAELSTGTGLIKGLHRMEERLNKIPGLHVLNLRPAYFMENLLWGIDLIKSKGINGNTIRGDLRIPMIATRDIAAAAGERLVKRDFTGATVQYLLGQRDINMIEATEIIGKKIDKPGLMHVAFPFDEAEKGMRDRGLSADVSRLYTEMGRAFNDGLIVFEKRSPRNTTPTSFERFCDEVFVPLYTQKKAA